MAEQEKKKGLAKKRPTPLKRLEQSKKRQKRNAALKSRVRTALKAFTRSLEVEEKEKSEPLLSRAYSLIDKSVKTHVFKVNKAARMKSRLATLYAATSS